MFKIAGKIALLGILTLAACSRPEPGPAERIGRSIDELSQGLKEYERQAADEDDSYDRERSRRRRDLDRIYGDEDDNPFYDGEYRDPYRR